VLDYFYPIHVHNFIWQMSKTGLLPVRGTCTRKRLLVEFDFGQSGGVEEGMSDQAASVLVEVVSFRNLRRKKRRAWLNDAKQANFRHKINSSKVKWNCSEDQGSNREVVAFAEESTWKCGRTMQFLLRFPIDWLCGVINVVLQHACALTAERKQLQRSLR
jgi:hypothetical protein